VKLGFFTVVYETQKLWEIQKREAKSVAARVNIVAFQSIDLQVDIFGFYAWRVKLLICRV